VAITGYASATSVYPNDQLSFCCSSDAGTVSADFTFERIGDGALPETINAQVVLQAPPPAKAWEGFNWAPSAVFIVPDPWPTGLYRVSANGAWIADFVVRPLQPTSRILLQICFNTENAYCDVGGNNLYWKGPPLKKSSSRAEKVSFDRPGIEIGGEIPFINWLKSKNINVDYCSSVDLTDPSVLENNYDLLLIAGHSEYWSKEARDQVERFVRNGGNVAVFGGNTCYRQVRFEQNNRLMVFYKYASNDPMLGVDNDRVTVAFNQNPVCRPPNSLLGIGFADGGGRWGDPDESLRNEVYAIRTPDHWVFEGVAAATLGDNLGLMGYETDAAPIVDEPEGYARALTTESTPICFTPLATADMRATWQKAGKAGMSTVGLHVRNGTVFAAGTVGWSAALTEAGPAADDLSRVTFNVISRLGQRQSWNQWEHIGHANDGVAMAALDNKLFLATTQGRLWRRYPIGANIVWKDLGDIGIPPAGLQRVPLPKLIALAGDRELLFAADSHNSIWYRPGNETQAQFSRIGNGPATGIKAMAATSGLLYVVDSKGALWVAPISMTSLNRDSWYQLPLFTDWDAKIRCLAGINDILFATTDDNRLCRTTADFVHEATGWRNLMPAYSVVGIAAIDTMLFVATTEDKLWWVDFLHFPAP
jgi:hypothetical protein